MKNKLGQTALSLQGISFIRLNGNFLSSVQGNSAQVISRNHSWEILNKSPAQDYNLAKGAGWTDVEEGCGSILDDDLQKKNLVSILNLQEVGGYFEIVLHP